MITSQPFGMGISSITVPSAPTIDVESGRTVSFVALSFVRVTWHFGGKCTHSRITQFAGGYLEAKDADTISRRVWYRYSQSHRFPVDSVEVWKLHQAAIRELPVSPSIDGLGTQSFLCGTMMSKEL